MVTNTAGFIEGKLSHMPHSAYNSVMAKLGFLGLGIMGYPMARNLLRAGHEVALWTHSAAKARELAAAEKDYATLSFLKWFLDEQVEEERNVGDILAKLELVGDNRSALYQIDQHAARRAEEKD